MRKQLAIASLAVLSILAVILGLNPAQAQTAQNTLTMTTLSADVSTSSNTVQLASVTGITVAQNTTATILYIDGEEMVVLAVNTTAKTAHVSRGQGGTPAAGHRSGVMVLAGNPTWFFNHDPQGLCSSTTASVLATPYVNVINGNQRLCSTVTKTWVPGFQNSHLASLATVTTLVASAAGTVTPSGPLFHINGTNAITGFVTPVGCNATAVGACQFTVIPDATFTWTTATNIALAGTAVVNKTITFTWDATNSKWVPSVVG